MELILLGASEVSANLYCNSRTSVLGRLRDYLRLLMKRSVVVRIQQEKIHRQIWIPLSETPGCCCWTWVVEEMLAFLVLGCVLRTAGSSII